MQRYELRGIENERIGEVHTWMTRDGKSLELADVVSDLAEQKEEIVRLREALHTCRCLAQGDKHATYLDRCVAIDVHVYCVLQAAGGE